MTAFIDINPTTTPPPRGEKRRAEEAAPGFAEQIESATRDQEPAGTEGVEQNEEASEAETEAVATNEGTPPKEESAKIATEVTDDLLALTYATETIVLASSTTPVGEKPSATIVDATPEASEKLLVESTPPSPTAGSFSGDGLLEETQQQPQLETEVETSGGTLAKADTADESAAVASVGGIEDPVETNQRVAPNNSNNEVATPSDKLPNTETPPTAPPAATKQQAVPETLEAGSANNPSDRLAETESEKSSASTAPPAKKGQSTLATPDLASNDTTASTPTADEADQRATQVVARSEQPTLQESSSVDRPSQGSPNVDPARFVSRVTRAIDFANERGGGPVEMRLSPPELGSLQVKIELKEGVMTASLEVDSSTTRQTLLDNLPALRDRLEQQQIRIDSFDVDVRDDADQRGGDSPAPHDGDRRPDERQASQEDRHTTDQDESAERPTIADHQVATIDFGDDAINVVA